ncbi:MAG TPA: sensor histidine kinase, partial [Labilithrix sp.]|nr:sensor histidine kinase [Labilithrix sp.]
MLSLSAYALLSLWAATLAVGFSALRMGRARAQVMALPSLFLGAWVTGLVILETKTNDALAERVLPLGVLLAGAYAQATSSLAGASRKVVQAVWIGAAVVALLGLVVPRSLYGAGARGPGPLFWPLGIG